jgi:hypothetical protein
MIKTKAFGTFIRVYALFKSERLSTNIKLTLHKALIRSVMTMACLVWEIAAPGKQGTLYHWELSKPHTGSRNANGFPFVIHA